MKGNKITTLFLDIGGVLLTNGWDVDSRMKAIKKFSLNKKEMEQRHFLYFDTHELGKLTLNEYLEYVIFYEERNFPIEEFKHFMFQQSQKLEGAIEFFKKLKKERGYKVVALSNESRELNDYRIEKFRLHELFDSFISSCYVHLRKPDPDIYRMACDTAQALPAEAIYIDDRKMYVEMAMKLGIKSLHYRGVNSAKEYFKKIIQKNN